MKLTQLQDELRVMNQINNNRATAKLYLNMQYAIESMERIKFLYQRANQTAMQCGPESAVTERAIVTDMFNYQIVHARWRCQTSRNNA